MKKSSRKSKATKASAITPEEAVEFLENMRLMVSEVDEATEAISIRIPGNILRTLKLKAKAEGKKYQSLIVEYIRQGLKS